MLDLTPHHLRFDVLIETYWNVNVKGIASGSACLSINRNILECKGLKNLSMQQGVRY